MVKLPQVATVVKAQSAEGLSPLSFELETLGLMIAATYGVLHNLAFSAYGESMVCDACYDVVSVVCPIGITFFTTLLLI